MTNPENPEKTTGGLAGRAVGKAKEVAGEVTGNEDLAREGRLQQAQGEAADDAAEARKDAEQAAAEARLEDEKAHVEEERQLLDTELAETRREDQIEADLGRAEQAADQRAADEIAAADSERRAQETIAERTDKLADAERREQGRAALELEDEARQAELRAEALDPKENS